MHPIATSSNTRKPKKYKEKKSRQHKASSPNADAHHPGTAAATTPPRTETPRSTAPAPAPTSAATARAVVVGAKKDGLVPAECDGVEFGDFDFDAVSAEEGAELWLVRAPSSVKAKSLHGLEVSHRTGLVGDLVRKSAAYDVWALEPAVDGVHGSGGENQGEIGGTEAGAPVGLVGAEELNNLSVLLPCKRKGGKLYLAPKPITRHLVVVSRPANPSTPDAMASDAVLGFENPKREAYPEEVLTHRFRPYGDPGDIPPEDNHMDVDTAEVSLKGKEGSKRRGGETRSSKKKKAKLVAS